MNKKYVSDAIGNISTRHIEEAENYTVAKGHRRSFFTKAIVAVACLCLLVAAAFSLFPGKEPVSPFVITAYAMEADGSAVWHEMKLDEKIKLAYTDNIKHAAGRYISGYCFDLSQPDMDINDYFVASAVTDENGRILPTNEETIGLHGEKCRWFMTPGNDIVDVTLYAYVPSSSDFEPLSDFSELTPDSFEQDTFGKYIVWQPNDENNVYLMVSYYTADYKLAVTYYFQMTQESDGYYAVMLNSETISTVGGVDGPTSVETKKSK